MPYSASPPRLFCQDFGDLAYTTHALPLHNDGTYFDPPPGYQAFHCLAFDGTGGASLAADGMLIAQRLREEEPDLHEYVAAGGAHLANPLFITEDRVLVDLSFAIAATPFLPPHLFISFFLNLT